MGIEDVDVRFDESEQLVIVVIESCDVEESAYGVADTSTHIDRIVSVWNDDEDVDVAADSCMAIECSIEKAYQWVHDVAQRPVIVVIEQPRGRRIGMIDEMESVFDGLVAWIEPGAVVRISIGIAVE